MLQHAVRKSGIDRRRRKWEVPGVANDTFERQSSRRRQTLRREHRAKARIHTDRPPSLGSGGQRPAPPATADVNHAAAIACGKPRFRDRHVAETTDQTLVQNSVGGRDKMGHDRIDHARASRDASLHAPLFIIGNAQTIDKKRIVARAISPFVSQRQRAFGKADRLPDVVAEQHSNALNDGITMTPWTNQIVAVLVQAFSAMGANQNITRIDHCIAALIIGPHTQFQPSQFAAADARRRLPISALPNFPHRAPSAASGLSPETPACESAPAHLCTARHVQPDRRPALGSHRSCKRRHPESQAMRGIRRSQIRRPQTHRPDTPIDTASSRTRHTATCELAARGAQAALQTPARHAAHAKARTRCRSTTPTATEKSATPASPSAETATAASRTDTPPAHRTAQRSAR